MLQDTHLNLILKNERFRSYLASHRDQLWSMIDKQMLVKSTTAEKAVVACTTHLPQALMSPAESTVPCPICAANRSYGYQVTGSVPYPKKDWTTS